MVAGASGSLAPRRWLQVEFAALYVGAPLAIALFLPPDQLFTALAVFSLAALALVRLQGVTLRTAADLDSKALGQIIARNLMVEVQSDVAPPAVGEEDGEVENGGRRWHWTRTVKATEDKRLLQVDLVIDGQPGASPVVLSFLREVE